MTILWTKCDSNKQVRCITAFLKKRGVLVSCHALEDTNNVYLFNHINGDVDTLPDQPAGTEVSIDEFTSAVLSHHGCKPLLKENDMVEINGVSCRVDSYYLHVGISHSFLDTEQVLGMYPKTEEAFTFASEVYGRPCDSGQFPSYVNYTEASMIYDVLIEKHKSLSKAERIPGNRVNFADIGAYVSILEDSEHRYQCENATYGIITKKEEPDPQEYNVEVDWYNEVGIKINSNSYRATSIKQDLYYLDPTTIPVLTDSKPKPEEPRRKPGTLVTFVDIGATVRIRPCSRYADQDKDAAYGVIIKERQGYSSLNVRVEWFDANHDHLSENSYTAQSYEQDLYYVVDPRPQSQRVDISGRPIVDKIPCCEEPSAEKVIKKNKSIIINKQKTNNGKIIELQRTPVKIQGGSGSGSITRKSGRRIQLVNEQFSQHEKSPISCR